MEIMSKYNGGVTLRRIGKDLELLRDFSGG